MNKSPDWTDPAVLESAAGLEDRLRALEHPPADPELAADWALRKELRRLKPEPLPAELADRWKHMLRPRGRGLHSAWGFAIAASLVLALSLTLLMPINEPEPDPTAIQDFRLAMQTVNTTSRKALSITGRELNEHLQWPSIELEPLPYSRLVRAIAQPQRINVETQDPMNDLQTNQE